MDALGTAYKDLKVPQAAGAPAVTPPPVPAVAAAKTAAGFDITKQAAPNTDAMARSITDGAASVAGMLNPANIKVDMAPRTPPPSRVDNSIISPGVDAAIVSGAQAADQGMRDFSNAAVDGAQRAGTAVKGALDARFNPKSNYVGDGPTDPDVNARPNNKPIDLKDSVAGVYNRLIGNSAQSVVESLPDYNAKNGVNFVADEGRMARTLGTNVFAPTPAPATAPVATPTAGAPTPPAAAPAPAAPTVTPAAAPVAPIAQAPAAPGPAETGPRAFTMANGQRMITNVDGNSNAAAGGSNGGMQPPGAPQPVLSDMANLQSQLANIQALRGPEPAPQQFVDPGPSQQEKENAEKTQRWAMQDIAKAGQGGRLQAAMAAAQLRAMTDMRGQDITAGTAAGGHAVQARGQDKTADTAIRTTGMNNQTNIATTGMNNNTHLGMTRMNNQSAANVAGIQGQTQRDTAKIHGEYQLQNTDMQGANMFENSRIQGDNHLKHAGMITQGQLETAKIQAAERNKASQRSAHPVAGSIPGTAYHWNEATGQYVLVTQPTPGKK